MVIKEIILYHMDKPRLDELERYSLTRENLKELKKFVRLSNRNLFLGGNNNEKFFFKIKEKEKVN